MCKLPRLRQAVFVKVRGSRPDPTFPTPVNLWGTRQIISAMPARPIVRILRLFVFRVLFAYNQACERRRWYKRYETKVKVMAIPTVDHYELIQQLTTSIPAPPLDNRRRLNDFAFELGWRPSDQLSLPGTEEFASGHLVVEHGLQNSAVISFLRKPARYPNL